MSHNLTQLRRRRDDWSATDNALQRLKTVMHERRQITVDDVRAIAHATHQPEATVLGVATYYGDLGMHRRGRTRVKVCKGTACFAACGDASVGWLEDALGVKLEETKPDGSVSLEAVYCLGYCNAGPTVAVEERVYGELTPERAECARARHRGERPFRRLIVAHDSLVPAVRGARRPGDRARAARRVRSTRRSSTRRATARRLRGAREGARGHDA